LNNTFSSARQAELLHWWKLSLYSYNGSQYVSLSDYALDKLIDIRLSEKTLDDLEERMSKCPAKCPAQFRQWCYGQIDKQAAKIVRANEGAEKALRKGTKPFQYEQHGNVCFIPLFDSKKRQHIWTIPADWLDEAKLLWPVHIRRYADGKPYVSRKVATPSGQKNVAIHRLFLGLSAMRHEFEDNLEVQNRDGNWLNYCAGNLFLAAGSDLLDHATAPLQATEYKPIKAFDPRRIWRFPTDASVDSQIVN
jgi:hypothetical protein